LKKPELRQNLVTRQWVIISPQRANRPHDFEKKENKKETLPRYSPKCPFCRGNEKWEGSAEVLRIGDKKNWRVRVIPNKYPVLLKEGVREWQVSGIKRKMTGIGIHEVIIESPWHNLSPALFSQQQIIYILQAYKKRFREIAQDKRLEQIIIFKNHGEAAGTSLIHPHSQLVATPIVPYQIRFRYEEAERYFDNTGRCVFCQILAEELSAGERIITQNKHFVSFVPYAALSPYHIWIFPKVHACSFQNITLSEIKDLASILKDILARLYFGLDNPAYNYIIRSSPLDISQSDCFHWYISIVARVTKSAGFELGSGMFVNPLPPEESAKFLRNVKLD
jgi:UDPglucose--hexose-1-phosphate uridylyltransferase